MKWFKLIKLIDHIFQVSQSQKPVIWASYGPHPTNATALAGKGKMKYKRQKSDIGILITKPDLKARLLSMENER